MTGSHPPARLTAADLASPEAFTAAVRAHVAAAHADATSVRAVPPLGVEIQLGGGGSMQIDLRELWQRVRARSVDESSSEVARWVAATIEARPDAVRAGDPADHVVPLVRPAAYVASIDGMLANAGGLAHVHVAADLHVIYAMDHREGIQMLDWDGARAAGVAPETIAERARANLLRIVRDQLGARVHPTLGVGFVAAGGTFESSILVLDAYWDHVERQLGGGVLAAVPARDTLVFCREDAPEAVAELRRHIDRAWSGDHLVSRTILRRAAGRWVPWAAPPA